MGHGGGEPGVWGQRERAIVRAMFGLPAAGGVEDGEEKLALDPSFSGKRDASPSSVKILAIKRRALSKPLVDEAFEGLGQASPTAVKYTWCESAPSF